ncbi:hypothetical protein QA640_42660 [Bradyrhizobium sp. CB82]|uniref:hypothetical protein n=1 Tax=Bradyrhizobium sp. CB82 TaxID=3039159 RepID=UPI0024B1EC37|nr:hypothetical protein [Bradyrhizobium sp. CB82]WFU40786.1 hypothetical protein QA640_42660 [Bradyrhizobium sp. CB82]
MIDADRFKKYAVKCGLSASSLTRILLVRRLARPSQGPLILPKSPPNRGKIVVSLPVPLLTAVEVYAAGYGGTAPHIAALEILAEIEQRTLEHFLLKG